MDTVTSMVAISSGRRIPWKDGQCECDVLIKKGFSQSEVPRRANLYLMKVGEHSGEADGNPNSQIGPSGTNGTNRNAHAVCNDDQDGRIYD